jgi:hypothetical protein
MALASINAGLTDPSLIRSEAERASYKDDPRVILVCTVHTLVYAQ